MSWAGDSRQLRAGFIGTGYWMVSSYVHSGVIGDIDVVESVLCRQDGLMCHLEHIIPL